MSSRWVIASRHWSYDFIQKVIKGSRPVYWLNGIYIKNSDIEISVKIGTGDKSFTVYTMDLTKKYIEINADYRS